MAKAKAKARAKAKDKSVGKLSVVGKSGNLCVLDFRCQGISVKHQKQKCRFYDMAGLGPCLYRMDNGLCICRPAQIDVILKELSYLIES